MCNNFKTFFSTNGKQITLSSTFKTTTSANHKLLRECLITSIFCSISTCGLIQEFARHSLTIFSNQFEKKFRFMQVDLWMTVFKRIELHYFPFRLSFLPSYLELLFLLPTPHTSLARGSHRFLQAPGLIPLACPRRGDPNRRASGWECSPAAGWRRQRLQSWPWRAKPTGRGSGPHGWTDSDLGKKLQYVHLGRIGVESKAHKTPQIMKESHKSLIILGAYTNRQSQNVYRLYICRQNKRLFNLTIGKPQVTRPTLLQLSSCKTRRTTFLHNKKKCRFPDFEAQNLRWGWSLRDFLPTLQGLEWPTRFSLRVLGMGKWPIHICFYF